MRHLVFNTASSHLYKKSKHLVRTPIKMTLTADQYAYYVVAGDYTAQNLPDKGFIRQLTADNVDYVGYDCLQAYNNPNRLQIWRNTNIWPIPSTWSGFYDSLHQHLQCLVLHRHVKLVYG